MSTLKRVAQGFFGEQGAQGLNDMRNAWRISRSPDRTVLLRTLLPAFSSEGGHILWIGCRRYTASYPARLSKGGGEVWTTDIAPEVEAWGAKDRHRTGDVCEIDQVFDAMIFDAVLCNGVLGYGVDKPQDQTAALQSIVKVLKPGGRLLLGWNTDKVADPLTSGVLPPVYLAQGFQNGPARIECPPTTHVYDLFKCV